ncbi:MAG: sugar phosphate isomerase/epimerase [Planctomycetota bacterium]|nr:MAG: sugar phosphate isomerase/epimerase [Planctomycetota bacterium]
MPAPPVSVWLDSYRKDIKSALLTAARDGFRCVQLNTSHELFDPRELTTSAKRHLRRTLDDLGLRVDAVSPAFTGRGLADPALADQRADRLRHTLTLCRDLGCPSTFVAIDGLHDPEHAALAREMLAYAANWADGAGVQLAVDPRRREAIDALRDALDALRAPHVGAMLDTIRHGADPQDLRQLAGRVGVLHVRDGRRAGDAVEETPLGEGELDLAAVLATVAQAGFAAAPAVRLDSPGAVDALRRGRETVESLLRGGA